MELLGGQIALPAQALDCFRVHLESAGAFDSSYIVLESQKRTSLPNYYSDTTIYTHSLRIAKGPAQCSRTGSTLAGRA